MKPTPEEIEKEEQLQEAVNKAKALLTNAQSALGKWRKRHYGHYHACYGIYPEQPRYSFQKTQRPKEEVEAVRTEILKYIQEHYAERPTVDTITAHIAEVFGKSTDWKYRNIFRNQVMRTKEFRAMRRLA